MKDSYNKPELEIIEIDLKDSIMAMSDITFSDEKYDGAANSKKRGIWGSDE